MPEFANGVDSRQRRRVRRDDGLMELLPSTKLEVASTAGAGDALLGGIIAALAAGIPFLQAGSSEWTSSRPIGTALELGVLLASYKCLSPHTIHPSASIETLIDFGRDHGRPFSPQLQELLTSLVLDN